MPATGPERAVPALLRAAEAATARLAEKQAQDQLRRALELIERLPPSLDRDRRRLDALLRLHSSLMKGKGWTAPETAEAFSKARLLAERLGETRQLVQLLHGAWTIDLVSGRHEAARTIGDVFLPSPKSSNSTADLAVAHTSPSQGGRSTAEICSSPGTTSKGHFRCARHSRIPRWHGCPCTRRRCPLAALGRRIRARRLRSREGPG